MRFSVIHATFYVWIGSELLMSSQQCSLYDCKAQHENVEHNLTHENWKNPARHPYFETEKKSHSIKTQLQFIKNYEYILDILKDMRGKPNDARHESKSDSLLSTYITLRFKRNSDGGVGKLNESERQKLERQTLISGSRRSMQSYLLA